jgi:hypothetical protein
VLVSGLGLEGVMIQPRAHKRYRCRSCGLRLPAWLPMPEAPDGAMALEHLSQQHPTELGPFLERMRTTEGRAQVAAQGVSMR